jgi:Putative adhesin
MDRKLLLATALGMTLASGAQAAKSVNEQRAADPHAAVEINAVSGKIRVQGWDKPTVEVTGTLGNDQDRVEVSGDPAHVSIQVIQRSNIQLWGTDGGPRLTVRVPTASSLSLTLVSTDFAVSELSGDLDLHTVSGDASGDVGGNLRVTTVSGDVHMNAHAAKMLAVKTVSGDMVVSGGDGEADISTVSGDARITLGTQRHVRLKTVSGEFVTTLALTNDAQLDGESVSGDLSLKLTGPASGDFDIETHSGSIENCFGPKPTEARHGPGSKLQFKEGSGSSRVHIVTNSGDVAICANH